MLSVYEALLINAGQPVVPVALNGYGYFLPLAAWFQVFDWLGLIPVHDLGGLLAAPDFDVAYAALIEAGRWFSVFLAWMLVGLMYVGICALFGKQGGGRWAAGASGRASCCFRVALFTARAASALRAAPRPPGAPAAASRVRQRSHCAHLQTPWR